jgi:hypothetical protein
MADRAQLQEFLERDFISVGKYYGRILEWGGVNRLADLNECMKARRRY